MFNRVKNIFQRSYLGSLPTEIERRVLLAFDLANFPKEYYDGVLFCVDDSLTEGINGLFRPRTRNCVFINESLPWHEIACILAHELVHRRDFLNSPLKYRFLSLPGLCNLYLEPQAITWEDKVRKVCSENMSQILKMEKKK